MCLKNTQPKHMKNLKNSLKQAKKFREIKSKMFSKKLKKKCKHVKQQRLTNVIIKKNMKMFEMMNHMEIRNLRKKEEVFVAKQQAQAWDTATMKNAECMINFNLDNDTLETDLACLEVDLKLIEDEQYHFLMNICGAKQVGFYRKKIRANHAKIIANQLVWNNFLISADLSYNLMGDQGAFYLCIALKYNSTLKSLKLDHNEITDLGALDFAYLLEENSSLNHLSLAKNNISTLGINKISHALLVNSTLKTLTIHQGPTSNIKRKLELDIMLISGTGFEFQDSQLMSTYIKQNESLILYRRNFNYHHTIIISTLLLKNRFVTQLDLSYNEAIRNAGAEVIAKLLSRNAEANLALKILDISCCGIGTEGIKKIACALTNNSVLTSLNISKNKFHTEGVESVACALKANSTLKYLVLFSKNALNISEFKSNVTRINCHRKKFTDMEALMITSLLGNNKKLKKLILSKNQIGNAGAKAVADLISSNMSLTELNLSNNKIGDSGGKSLAQALRTNFVLKSLNLSMNSIGTTGKKAIFDAAKITGVKINMENNSSLVSVCLSGG